MQIPTPHHCHLVIQLHIFCRHGIGQPGDFLFGEFVFTVGAANDLVDSNPLQVARNVIEQAGIVGELLIDFANRFDDPPRVTPREQAHDPHDMIPVDRA